MGLGGLVFVISFPILLGYTVKQFRIFESDEIDVLRKYVVRITVPFIIFRNLYNADMSMMQQIYPGIAALFVLTSLFVLTACFFRRFAAKDPYKANGFAIAVFLGNYGYLGWGVLHSFYGEEGFVRAIFFTMFFWPIILFLGFLMIFFIEGKDGRRESGFAGKAMGVMVKNAAIPVMTVIIVLFVKIFDISLPEALVTSIENFSQVTIPTILFSIGLSFSLKMNFNDIKTLLLGSSLRLIFGIIPGYITVVLISLFFSPDNMMKKVILLESVMPTAAMSPFFIRYIRSDSTTVSNILTFSTLMSLITLPMWYLIIEKIF